jgi:hypothetical protein
MAKTQIAILAIMAKMAPVGKSVIRGQLGCENASVLELREALDPTIIVYCNENLSLVDRCFVHCGTQVLGPLL